MLSVLSQSIGNDLTFVPSKSCSKFSVKATRNHENKCCCWNCNTLCICQRCHAHVSDIDDLLNSNVLSHCSRRKRLNIDVHRNISFLDIKDTLFIYIVKGMVERIICFTVLPMFCLSFGIIWPMTSSYRSLPSSSSRVLQVSLCVVFRFLTCERITFIILRVHTNNLNSKIYIFERQNSIEWERKRSFFLWFISQMDTDWNQEPGMSSGSPTWMTGIQTFGQPSPALRCVLARS